MQTNLRLSMLLFLLLSMPAMARAAGTESASAAVARLEREQALAEGGDAASGKEAFEVCAACHLPSGFGRRDGTYPKLAGQHRTVLIKQIADIRAEARENRNMHEFALELKDARDIANVAAHVESLCIPPGNGRYALPDAEKRVAEGRQLFVRDCADCHAAEGQGNGAKGYPVLAGQHYRYLLRQMSDIRDGYRVNVDPDMVSTIRKHPNAALESIAAFLATLTTPGTPCEVKETAKSSSGGN